jgi:RNase P/RNase MRP subunit p30
VGGQAALMKACGVGGVVLTSGALRAMELRGPYDVVNLASLLELNTNAAKVRERRFKLCEHLI